MLFYFLITWKQKQSTRQMYYMYCGCFIYSCWHLEEHSCLCLVCWYFGDAWQKATWSLLKWFLKHFMNGSSCLVTKVFAGLLGFTPLSFIAMSLTMIPTFSCAVAVFFRLCLSSKADSPCSILDLFCAGSCSAVSWIHQSLSLSTST